MAVTNYTQNIADLLSSHWTVANMERRITPTVDTDWAIKAWSAPHRICVREMQSDHRVIDLNGAVHEVKRMYQVDLYSMDRNDALDIREETDRIINEHNSDPFTGVTFIVQGKWEDLTGTSGNYVRYACTLEAISYVNA